MVPNCMRPKPTGGALIAINEKKDVRVVKHFEDHTGKYRYFLQKVTDYFFGRARWKDAADTISDTIYDSWTNHYGLELK